MNKIKTGCHSTLFLFLERVLSEKELSDVHNPNLVSTSLFGLTRPEQNLSNEMISERIPNDSA